MRRLRQTKSIFFLFGRGGMTLEGCTSGDGNCGFFHTNWHCEFASFFSVMSQTSGNSNCFNCFVSLPKQLSFRKLNAISNSTMGHFSCQPSAEYLNWIDLYKHRNEGKPQNVSAGKIDARERESEKVDSAQKPLVLCEWTVESHWFASPHLAALAITNFQLIRLGAVFRSIYIIESDKHKFRSQRQNQSWINVAKCFWSFLVPASSRLVPLILSLMLIKKPFLLTFYSLVEANECRARKSAGSLVSHTSFKAFSSFRIRMRSHHYIILELR